MMKRIAALLAALLLVPALAGASQLYTYENAHGTVRFECEDFGREMPAELAQLPVFRAGDQIVGGTICAEYWKDGARELREKKALVALRREGKLLIVGAALKDGVWNACVETDSFFDGSQRPVVTAYKDVGILFSVSVGEERYRMNVSDNGTVYLLNYEVDTDDGRTFTLDLSAGGLYAAIMQNGQRVWVEEAHGQVPRRLFAWTYASLPTSIPQMQAYARLNPAALESGQAYVFGVNFREQPTGDSQSMGLYTARVRVLGETSAGVRAPWHHVAVGDTQGWVSGVYLVDAAARKTRICEEASKVLAVARMQQEGSLLSEPGGNGKQLLRQGTMMHVISERDGWLHVVIPRGEITWKTDWDGTYGFVRKSSVVIGQSLADLYWK